jgi:hypothetical protein
MATTVLTKTALPGPYDTDGVTITWQAADAANGNHFIATGKEILIARNDDAGAQTVTVTSTPDPQGRTGDISADSIAAAAYHAWQKFPVSGWRQTAGTILVTASDAGVFLAVLQLP